MKTSPIPVVGVVFRGSLWLDGIITCAITLDECNPTTQLSSAIIDSRHYTQLRAVILSDHKIGKHELDIETLTSKIRRPIIVLRPVKSTIPMKKYRFQFRGRRLTVRASGTDMNMIKDVFRIGCAPDSPVPEALRVAGLITKNLPTSANLQEIR